LVICTGGRRSPVHVRFEHVGLGDDAGRHVLVQDDERRDARIE
jgi:hypothetical protein